MVRLFGAAIAAASGIAGVSPKYSARSSSRRSASSSAVCWSLLAPGSSGPKALRIASPVIEGFVPQLIPPNVRPVRRAVKAPPLDRGMAGISCGTMRHVAIDPVIIKPRFPVLSKAGRWLFVLSVPWFFGALVAFDALGLDRSWRTRGAAMACDRRSGSRRRAGAPPVARTPAWLAVAASANSASPRDQPHRPRSPTAGHRRAFLSMGAGHGSSIEVWRS